MNSKPVPWPAVKPPVPASKNSLPLIVREADPPLAYIAQSPNRWMRLPTTWPYWTPTKSIALSQAPGMSEFRCTRGGSG